MLKLFMLRIGNSIKFHDKNSIVECQRRIRVNRDRVKKTADTCTSYTTPKDAKDLARIQLQHGYQSFEWLEDKVQGPSVDLGKVSAWL